MIFFQQFSSQFVKQQFKNWLNFFLLNQLRTLFHQQPLLIKSTRTHIQLFQAILTIREKAKKTDINNDMAKGRVILYQ
jgi:hypothetical protein